MRINTIHHMCCVNGMRQLRSRTADLIIADPPFERDKINREFFIDFTLESFRCLKENSWLVLFEHPTNAWWFLPYLKHLGFSYRQTIIWDKGQSQMARRNITNLRLAPTCTQHIWTFVKQPDKLIKKRIYFQLPKDLNNRLLSDVWSDIKWYKPEDSIHPCHKPVELYRRLIQMFCPATGLTLDLFAGGGSAAIACKLLKREFISFELDGLHQQTAMKRFVDYTTSVSVEPFFDIPIS